jgi:hypothetical protein
MDFTVEFYETESAACPVRDFLDDLKKSDPDDFAIVAAGLAKLQNSQYHREPRYGTGTIETSGTPGTGLRYKLNTEFQNRRARLTA